MNTRKIVILVLLCLLGIVPAYAASSVTGATVTYNPAGVNICDLPQTSVTIDLTGVFDSNDGGNLDAFAVKLIDGRRASLWPVAGTASNIGPREGGRADLRYFQATTGTTSASVTASVYHPSLNPVRIEVYEVTNFVANGNNSTGELGRLLYSRTYEAPCEGAGAPPDDRISDELTGPVVVYARDNQQVAVEIWRILSDGEGQLALTISASQLQAVPATPLRATRIAGTLDGIELYRLTTGECQVNAPETDGSLYTLKFECPDVSNVVGTSGTTTTPATDTSVSIPGAPVLVNLPANNSRVAVEVYRLNAANEGVIALRVTFAQLNAVPAMPEENTRVFGLRDNSIVLYRLTTGECQVNATRADSTEPYVFIFECPTNN